MLTGIDPADVIYGLPIPPTKSVRNHIHHATGSHSFETLVRDPYYEKQVTKHMEAGLISLQKIKSSDFKSAAIALTSDITWCKPTYSKQEAAIVHGRLLALRGAWRAWIDSVNA